MAKKKILVITNECFKSTSANGYCIENIIKVLGSSNLVDVVAFWDREFVYDYSPDIKIYYVNNKPKSIIYDNNTLRRVINKFTFECICPDLNILHINRAWEKIESLFENNSYDLVIASSGGIVAQMLALRVKRKYQTRSISYFLDPPAEYNVVFKKNRPYYQRFKMLDDKVYEVSDAVILDQSIYEAMNCGERGNKFLKVGIPLLIDHGEMEEDDSNANSIAYIGTLYDDIRNPKYSIELLSKELNYRVDFYGGLLTKIIYEKYKSANTQYCGEVEHDKLKETISKYNYLLNISNLCTAQIPSKLIEYASYGKPILNIVKSFDDPTIKFIEHYGNGISIIEGDPNNIEIVKAFLAKPKPRISHNQLIEMFPIYSPEYTVRKIENFL